MCSVTSTTRCCSLSQQAHNPAQELPVGTVLNTFAKSQEQVLSPAYASIHTYLQFCSTESISINQITHLP